MLGLETATAVMEHLPPVGWADVATKRDLDHGLAALKYELLAEIHRSSRTTVLAMTFANTAIAGLVLGVAQLG